MLHSVVDCRSARSAAKLDPLLAPRRQLVKDAVAMGAGGVVGGTSSGGEGPAQERAGVEQGSEPPPADGEGTGGGSCGMVV